MLRMMTAACLSLLLMAAEARNNTNHTANSTAIVSVCDESYLLAWSISVATASLLFCGMFCFEVSSCDGKVS